MSTASIGAQIRGLRRARGWSLAELARRAGTSAPSLHRYERGWDRFELKTLRNIASALGARLEIRLIERQRQGPLKNRKPAEIVRLLSPLFWDRTVTPDDLREYPMWILCRTLMYGDLEQVRAVRDYFGDEPLRKALVLRTVDSRTRNFWTLVLEGEGDASQGTQ